MRSAVSLCISGYALRFMCPFTRSGWIESRPAFRRKKKKETFMRSRYLAAMLGAILAMGLAACSKKEQPAQTPPATADQSREQAPTANPQTQTAAGQPAAAPAASPTTAPVETAAAPPAAAPVAEQAPPPPPPEPIVIAAGKTVTVRMGNSLSSKTAQDGQT